MPSIKSTSKLKVTIAIPTLKSEKEIRKQIDEIHTNPPSCDYEVIASCIKQSAAKNRNWCIDNADGDIVIMIDDDITGFYPGWADVLIDGLFLNPDFSVVSARPLKEDGALAPTLGDCGNAVKVDEFQKCIHTEKTGLNVCCSSSISFWKNQCVRFDENYKAAVWEDFDWCLEMKKKYPDKDIVFANQCNPVHLNAMQGRTGADIEWNYKYCCEKWGLNF
jgi:glycosyltransferase involved in cell wall biosynthesis